MGFGHFQFRLGRARSRRSHITAPGSDARLDGVMLGGGFVARAHVSAREIGVHHLVVRLHFLGFVAFSNGGGKIAFGKIGATQSELGVEVVRIFFENSAKTLDRVVALARAEEKHRFVKLFLRIGHEVTVRLIRGLANSAKRLVGGVALG